jgi:hypothetical protein
VGSEKAMPINSLEQLADLARPVVAGTKTG